MKDNINVIIHRQSRGKINSEELSRFDLLNVTDWQR